ncbi:hypothetical protein ICC18_15060 [Paenibacillus sp. WST5]|uniref:Uncharacterized protein n=1 Tax=Paenibacillus sedimenti TaxID=2770274 RepID=A0A926QJD5_9BACL|nr:hypothetical protein [Paenibacillus sedimenti]
MPRKLLFSKQHNHPNEKNCQSYDVEHPICHSLPKDVHYALFVKEQIIMWRQLDNPFYADDLWKYGNSIFKWNPQERKLC